MIRINTHFRKMNILRKSMIFTLLISLLLSSFPAYAVTLADNSSNSALASSKLSNAVVVSEDTSKRGEFEKHYLLSDGSFMAVSYPEAVHYLSEGGTWEEVDNRLSLDRATSRIVNGDGDFSVSFADSPSGNSMASLLHNGKAFTWGLTATKLQNGELTQLNTFSTDKANIVSDDVASLVSARSGSLSTSSTSAIGKKVSDVDAFASDKLTGKLGYDELFEAVPELSVEYSVYHNKIEEDIFINAPTDLRAFSMNIQADGLTARLNDDGSVDFLDENGDMQYRIGIPYMEDANNEVLNDIEVTVDQSGNTCTVTYTPNEAWLTSEDRLYPILLDPSITTKEYNSNIVDTYVYEGNGANHSTEQKLYYGVKSGKIYRTYIKINNLPNIDANMPVIGATMELSFVSGTTTGKTAQVYKVSGSWNAGTITYANQPPIYSSNYLDSCLYNSSVAYMTFDLSTDVTTLYDEFLAANNYGYVIKYEDESNSNPDYNVFHSMESTTTAKRPVVTITYGYALPSSLSNGSEYSFQNYGSFSYMTVHNGTDANDVNVYQQSVSATSNLGTRHKFKLEYVPSTGGYYLRSMTSSGGTNRVLDIYKINGYVSNGSNVQIYSPNDPLAQHWFIIGTGISTFKIVPRTDMSLALTVYPGGDGSSSGTTTTSTGNIFVSTYDDTNDYQQWMIRDADGNLMSGSTQRVQNGTYYLNNRNYGKYLHKSSDTAVNAVSGLISTYENTIRWKFTHVGNDQYTIQSSDNLTKYLYSGNSTNARLATMLNITDNCLWTIRTASGGGILVQNVATQAYLKQTGSSTIAATSSLGTSGTTAYDRCVWRLASIDLISNRELTSGFSINEMILSVGDTKSPTINKTPSNAIWATASDFSYEISNTTGYTGLVTINGDNITGSISGMVRVKATHKATGKIKYFDIDVCEKAIIVLPGIMGSALYANSSFTYTNIVDHTFNQNAIMWDPPYDSAGAVIDIDERVLSLELSHNGAINYPVGVRSPIVNNNKDSYRKYGAKNYYKNVYLRLYEEFSDTYDVILYEYDWRFDPYDTAVDLKDYIEDNHYNDIVFVSHSMGGNVSSYYLALGADTRERVDKHISVGTPYLGAEKLAYVYDTGDALDVVKFGIDVSDALLADSIKQIMPNIPAIYSLLPMETHFTPYLQTKGSTGTITTKSTYSSTIDALESYLTGWNSTFYFSAKSHQALLFVNGKHVTQLVESYYIVGDDESTPSMLRITLNSSNQKTGEVSIASTTTSGDGTVSLHSALINGSVTDNILFKYSADNISAEHVGMITGNDDQKTFNYICDVINDINVNSYNDSTFFSRYSGYKEAR